MTLIEKVKAAAEKATPGPWGPGAKTFLHGFDGPAYTRIYTELPPTAVEMTDDNLSANAALIALAPDMAKALLAAEAIAEAMPHWMTAMADWDAGGPECISEMHELLDAYRAAKGG